MIALALAVGLVAAIYYYLTRNFDYWAKRGVKHDKPLPLFGTSKNNYLMRQSFAQVLTDAYKKYPGETFVGHFRGSSPELIIRDPAVARRVMITDFNYFHRRGIFPAMSDDEILKQNQFGSDDDLWRQLRLRMTPAFSSGKLKAMFPLIVGRTERLQARLDRTATKEQVIDARDLMARFTNDVIGTIGFGFLSDSLTTDDDVMRNIGMKVTAVNYTRVIKILLKTLFPKLLKRVKVHNYIEAEIVEMVETNMRQRNWEPSGRNDFIDILLECKKKGAMEGNSIVHVNADGTPKKVSIELDIGIMAAQCFVFFIAGFETSSSATSYTLFQLAHNQKAQQKVQKEIDTVLSKNDNQLSYEAISEMTYLRWCLNEGLRMFPSVAFLQRRCVIPYTFPGTNVTIDPDLAVLIPVDAYHNDPNIFPNPEEFRPERFDPDVLSAEQKLAYMPFGEGLRSCIGERLGLMQSMAGLAAVLSKYSIRPAPDAPRKLVVRPTSVVVQEIEGGVPMIFLKRDGR